MAAHQKLRADPTPQRNAQRRQFVSIQMAKAGVGAALALGYVALVGKPDAAEWVALAGLLAPAALAAFAFTRIGVEALEQASLALLSALIGYLVAFTGGLTSPLIAWLALVPAEAALAGGRPAVARATAAAALALVVVAGLAATGLLPATRLPEHPWPVYAASILAAIVQ
ncbi:MAG TPA: hypothetical protein VHC42_04310, partial [Rhizomicrobium sp.]|nr:hypothetical protein [Vicinamibacterales bacterium]HVV64667.1 hypothetical protein [Rhizomicrobium sp.]